MTLFVDGIDPADVIQGALGDCWLCVPRVRTSDCWRCAQLLTTRPRPSVDRLAAIAALAEFPAAVEKLFQSPGDIDGFYVISLWDPGMQAWANIIIDDQIPCEKEEWWQEARPLFARTDTKEAWVLLLEKAFAKRAGSYSKLEGGISSVAMVALTGCEEQQVWKAHDDGRWLKGQLNMDELRRDPTRSSVSYSLTNTTSSADEMLAFLFDCDDRSFILTCSIGSGSSGAALGEAIRPDGLVVGHTYSLIDVNRLDGGEGGGRFLRIRNPWGGETQKKWNGAWSHESALWKQHPEVSALLAFNAVADDDGLFWMSWEDFRVTFDTVCICCKSFNSSKTAGAASEDPLLPVRDKSHNHRRAPRRGDSEKGDAAPKDQLFLQNRRDEPGQTGKLLAPVRISSKCQPLQQEVPDTFMEEKRKKESLVVSSRLPPPKVTVALPTWVPAAVLAASLIGVGSGFLLGLRVARRR